MAKPEAIKPVQRTKHINLMVYGDPGVGKTRLIGTAPKTLILRPPTDHTDSIRDSDAEEWVIRDWNEMAEAQEYLRHEGAKNWDWVWLDSISLWQDTGLDDIWESVIAQKPHRAEFGLDKGEYGRNMQRLARWVRHMVGMDAVNFGITAHPFEGTDINGDVKLMPYVQGVNMAEKVMGYMNMVTYLEVREKKNNGGTYRVLHSQASEDYKAKDQFDALENGKLVEPTMPKIVKLIKAAQGTTPARSQTPKRRTRRAAKVSE